MQDYVPTTPLMKQYLEIKNNFQDMLLLFQVGDFYELFFDDAKIAAKILAITLTKRGNINGEPIPLCGVPVHVLEHHLAKLIKNGFKVAICNQLEDPVPGKLVKRAVVQVLTPGTLTDAKLLNEKSASYLLSFFPSQENWGMIFGEILTGQLFSTIISNKSFRSLESELTRFLPDEILIPNNKLGKQLESYFKQLGYFCTYQENKDEDNETIRDLIKNFLNDEVIYRNETLLYALYNFFSYLKKNQEPAIDQFKKINYYNPEDFLILDFSTQKNLELIKNNIDGSTKNTLLDLMDKAITPMGSRLIKKWIARPLLKMETITQRQEAIENLLKKIDLKERLVERFKEISDFERIVGKIALKKGLLNDYLQLLNVIKLIPKIKEDLKEICNIEIIKIIESNLINFNELTNLLTASLNDDHSKSWIIKPNFDLKLDKLRETIENSNKKILELENKEQKLTGIPSLKIKFNNLYGYYIEISKANLNSIPSDYKRQQSLSGKERFVTNDLQELQLEIETANKEINIIEQNVFENIIKEVHKYLNNLRKTSNALATLDALIGFTNLAYENGYVKPFFNQEQNILIEEGRHPIIEQVCKNKFIENSVSLTNEESILIITGPNMGGKSTYLRQTALICIMAQCGSYIPAKYASLPLLDKIFTRIGAGDNLSEGKSTFLVEMEETANICHMATNKSLIILDEVGRGTSTYDGLAIAQAVIEYIHKNLKSRCLFATHYHELNLLTEKYKGIVSYHAACKKIDKGILFLHKINKGQADSSYGIEVAKLANLPKEIILRANEILFDLTNTNTINSKIKQTEDLKEICKEDQIIEKLKLINFDEISPKKAFDLLWEIKDLLK